MRAAPGGAFTAVVRQVNPTFYKNLAQLRQNFQQRPDEASARNQKRNLPTAVLANFQIERQGQEVRILDQDGSVYTGQVINEESYAAGDSAAAGGGVASGAPAALNAVPAKGPNQLNQQGQPAKALAAALPVGQFYFRASGTNNTLRQVVVIEATLDHQLTGQAWPHKRTATADVRMQADPNTGLPPRQITLPKPSAGGNTEVAEKAKKAMAKREESALNRSRQAVLGLRVLGNARIGKENFPLNAYQAAAAAEVPADKKAGTGSRK
jgi:hypothetical protein